MRVAPLGMVVAVATFTCSSLVAADAGAPSDVVDKLRANESTYDDLDVTLVQKYVDPQRVSDATIDGADLRTVTARDDKIHFVSQSGMFRIEVESELSFQDKEPVRSSRTRAFDSKATRAVQTTGNSRGATITISGRIDDAGIVRPHMLLLRTMHYSFPLSSYLRGTSAKEVAADKQFPKDIEVEAVDEGEETWRELRCRRISINERIVRSADLHNRWVLWLAEDKNWIPARMEAYLCRFSKTIPVCEGRVTSWRELEPGVWFPAAAEVQRYNDFKLQNESSRERTWTTEYAVETASLHPKYKESYFEVVDDERRGERTSGRETPLP